MIRGFWRRLSGKHLLALLNIVAALAINFEGLAQGVMGSVNVSPEYIERMQLGSNGVVHDPTRQGGIVCIYYLGALFGGFWAGHVADKYGRIKGILAGCFWCIIGASLQSAAQNLNMMLCARVITGVGVGYLMCIVPAWSAEIAAAHSRGKFITITFLANFIGITTASWLGYGISHTDIGGGQFRWRFVLAFQMLPCFPLALGVLLLPESPRWLVKMGRKEEALEIIAKLRGNDNPDHPVARAEFDEIVTMVEIENKDQNISYWRMFLGTNSGDIHLARRIQLSFWLQVMMQYGTGIAAVVIYSATIFRTAGFDDDKSNWLSALCNTVGILGTAVAAFTLDKVGRRRTLFWGAVVLAIIHFAIGGLSRAAINQPENAAALGTGAAACVFIYLFFFSSTWLMIPFIYPTEIFPTHLRAKGNAFGVAGWAVGFGGGSLLVPIMFAGIGEKTFYVFGAAMFAWIPVIYVFFPETAKRSLESVDMLFASKSPFTWDEEKEYARRVEELRIRMAERGEKPLGGRDEEGLGKMSVVHEENVSEVASSK
ncbi:hypothetical protein YB2330_005264 [Saitoella coloradoensis]